MSYKYKNYNDFLYYLILKKFNNKVLRDGKRNKSDKIFIKTFAQLKSDSLVLNTRNIVELYEKILANIAVRFVIKFRKKGKSVQEIPVPLNSSDKVYSNTIKLIIKNFRSQKGKSFDQIFINEFKDILNNQGVLKKRVNEINKIVIKNRKFIN